MRTIIGVCLDESGSMGEHGKRAAAISAFNEYLREQQRMTADECLMAVARFNTVARITQKMAPVANLADLSEATYVPGGSTALFDAIAYTVREIERGITADDRVICVVLTDGEENSSKETTLEQVKELIAAKEAAKSWTFVYLSASPDAFAQGFAYGFAAGNTAQYDNTAQGTQSVMASVGHATTSLRASTGKSSRSMMSGYPKQQQTSRPVAPTPPIRPAPPATSAPHADTDMWGNQAS